MTQSGHKAVPVFIGGMGRSGTTLLVDLLGLHPQLSPIYETGFVPRIAKLLLFETGLTKDQTIQRILEFMESWTRPLPHQPHDKADHEHYHHGPHYILFCRSFALAQTHRLLGELGKKDTTSLFRSFVYSLFAEHARLDGKPFWVNKVPGYIDLLPVIEHIFPDMRFLHCVRDIRDVAPSARQTIWSSGSPAELAEKWVRRFRLASEFEEEHPGRLLQVKYEQLLSQPAAVLDEIVTWLPHIETGADSILARIRELGLTFDLTRIGARLCEKSGSARLWMSMQRSC